MKYDLLRWCDARENDVLGCIDLHASEESSAVTWIGNFRTAINKASAPPSRHQVSIHEHDISILLDALREIADPLTEWYKKSVAEGYKLDGHMAVVMSRHPNTFRSIAKKAIRDYQNR